MPIHVHGASIAGLVLQSEAPWCQPAPTLCETTFQEMSPYRTSSLKGWSSLALAQSAGVQLTYLIISFCPASLGRYIHHQDNLHNPPQQLMQLAVLMQTGFTTKIEAGAGYRHRSLIRGVIKQAGYCTYAQHVRFISNVHAHVHMGMQRTSASRSLLASSRVSPCKKQPAYSWCNT